MAETKEGDLVSFVWAGDRCEFMINLRSPAVTAPKLSSGCALEG